jgi:hypothetical protein
MITRILLTFLLCLLTFACSKDKVDSPKQAPEIEVCTFGNLNYDRSIKPPVDDGVYRRKTELNFKRTPVLFIDFDGFDASATHWSFGQPLITENSGLTGTQREFIVSRVAGHFKPFRIIVTDNEADYLKAPVASRIRIVVTTTWQWYGQVGGVAYIGSFSWGDNTPAFVFSSLLNYNQRTIADAISHEAGHTMGLRHQAQWVNCTFISEYNPGSALLGAPIMGYPYTYEPRWWYGPIPYDCATFQDDFKILKSLLGVY